MTQEKNNIDLHENKKEFVTVMVGKEVFGIPVLQVRDVLNDRKVTHVPLAPKEVEGSMNLRGRIVVAVNLRRKLGMPDLEPGRKAMHVVVDHQGELYSLVVDSVGEVLSLEDALFEKTPATLDASWRALATGIYRLKDHLLIILDTPGILNSLCVKDNDAA